MRTTEIGLVSTIIPVFNRPGMIKLAVQSVLAQSYRPIQIIIVDDGSTDETPNVIRQLVKQHEEIITVRQNNAGPGVARENGRQLASGEYIQYLDSDDQLLKEKFRLQVAALIDNPDCDVVYGKTDRQVFDGTQSMKAWKKTGLEIATMFPAFLESRWWGTSTPLYRRTITDKVGAWLPLINEEDWEYDCRVAAVSDKLVYVNEFVSVQYSHDDHLSHRGTLDPMKLRDRCVAREHMYQSSLNSVVEIPRKTMLFYSKSVFLLARECAAQDLGDCVKRMLALANMARGKTTFKQVAFSFIGRSLGWPVAAKIVKIVE